MPDDYREHYDEAGFRAKVAGLSGGALCRVARTALTLFLLLRQRRVPAWAKAAIVSALGYFVLPLDLVPHALPGVGYADDLTLMLALLGRLDAWATPAVRLAVARRLPAACR